MSNNVQTTYDALRGLGIVGSSLISEDENAELSNLLEHGRNGLPRHIEVQSVVSVCVPNHSLLQNENNTLLLNVLL